MGLRHDLQTCLALPKGRAVKRLHGDRTSSPRSRRSRPATQLLAAAGLPTNDLTDQHCQDFFYIGPATAPTGLVGLEMFGDVALLRSLVVRVRPWRSAGVGGSALVRHAEDHARANGVRAGSMLLTTTAEAFFTRRGYGRWLIAGSRAHLRFARRASSPASAPPAPRFFPNHCEDSNMNDKAFNVLFLCTGNSARSILAEALVNHWGRGKFVGFSAGSNPKGKVHPIALELLRHMKMPADGMRSESWDEFGPCRARRSSISCSPSATTPRASPVRSGPDNP